MFLSRVFLFALCVGIGYKEAHGIPLAFDPRTQFSFQDYDREAIARRLQEWKPEDKQNIWELSGLFEGDIMPSSEDVMKNGLLNENLRWPLAIVPVKIREGDFREAQIAVIMRAFEEFHNKTCIRFRPYEESDQDYVEVQGSQSGCWSHVGRQKKRQLLNLQNPGCVRHGVVIHEFLHALGSYHQQSAANRDEYVTIQWDNIISSTIYNFDKYDHNTVTDYGVEYDYGSVMHYSAFAFSKNGNATIQPKAENVQIGQRVGLSEKDISKVQLMYREICEARQSQDSDFRIFN